MAFNANANNKHNHPDATYLSTLLSNKTYKKMEKILCLSKNYL